MGRGSRADEEAERLRQGVQRFVRRFGLLAQDQTPCGKPLPPSQAHALMLLLERRGRGDEVTQRDLQEALGIDKSNVTRLCQRLEASGHLVQEVAVQDRRARILRLTEKGVKLATEVEAASRGRFARLLEGLPREDRAVVLGALERLSAAAAALEVSGEERER